jgi:hypothetical protein
MSYGLQIYRADGQIQLDISDRITKLYGTYSGNASLVNGAATPKVHSAFISVPGLVDDGSWYVGPPHLSTSTTFDYVVYITNGQIELQLMSNSSSSTLSFTISVLRG